MGFSAMSISKISIELKILPWNDYEGLIFINNKNSSLAF